MKTRTKIARVFAHGLSKGFWRRRELPANTKRILLAVRVRNERREENVKCCIYTVCASFLYFSRSPNDYSCCFMSFLFRAVLRYSLSLSRFLSDGIAEILFEELLFALEERNDACHDTETGRIKVFFFLSLSLGMMAYE